MYGTQFTAFRIFPNTLCLQPKAACVAEPPPLGPFPNCEKYNFVVTIIRENTV